MSEPPAAIGGKGGSGTGGVAGTSSAGGKGGTVPEPPPEPEPGDVLWTYEVSPTQDPGVQEPSSSGIVIGGNVALNDGPWVLELHASGQVKLERTLGGGGFRVGGVGVLDGGAVTLAGAGMATGYSVHGTEIPDNGTFVAKVDEADVQWVRAVDTDHPSNPWVTMVTRGTDSLVLGVSNGSVTVEGKEYGAALCPYNAGGGYALLLDSDGATLWCKVFCAADGTNGHFLGTQDGVLFSDGSSAFVVEHSRAVSGTDFSSTGEGASLLKFDRQGGLLWQLELFPDYIPGTRVDSVHALPGDKTLLVVETESEVEIGPLLLTGTEALENRGGVIVDVDGVPEKAVVFPTGTTKVAPHPSGDFIVAVEPGEVRYVARVDGEGKVIWRSDFDTAGWLGIRVDPEGHLFFSSDSDLEPVGQRFVYQELGPKKGHSLIGALQP